jgi:hypothetical protein
MALFGKSEKELKQIASDLEKRQTELDNRDADIKSKEENLAHERDLLAADKEKFEAERTDHTIQFKGDLDNVVGEKADLETRRSELSLLEAKAKADFTDSQREAFKEVFENRQAQLDGLQKDLDEQAVDLASRLEAFHTEESELARRELAVTEREQKADAGFADKAKSLAEETVRQQKANQDEAERLRKLADAIAVERKELEDNKMGLTQREQDILTAEQERDAGYAKERSDLQKEMDKTRKKRRSELEKDMQELRKKQLEEVTSSENAERERIRDEIKKERESCKKEQDTNRNLLESERTELEKQKGAVNSLQSELEGRKSELETSERTLERKDQRLEQQWKKRNDDLDEMVEEQVAERRRSLEDKTARLEREIADLRKHLESREEHLSAFEQLEQQLRGKDPDLFMDEIEGKREELMRLKEENANLRNEEMKALELNLQNQKARADQLAKQVASNEADIMEFNDLRRKNSELGAENQSLAQKASRWEGAATEADAELNRLRAAYERPAEVDARYKEIEMPHIKADEVKPPKKADIEETAWLKNIDDACHDYGIHFNPRILKAFHTALKTAEWSPLAVLAGVSGTGKSELPRLYSHFGGIFFEPLAVQPNWDSQESMLGFFNSIDNKFDAQPLLRFLAQSQKQWVDRTEDDEGYPGLQDAVCLVLLDEMNLAHPELYFAEFLSKLELRRGKAARNVPFLPVKIGAGMPPYPLPLGRNVLWAGTMNQDETTKSLSDKVLDRSIIIHFPRPTSLKRRLKLESLDEKNRGKILHKASWQSWLTQGSSFTDKDFKPYKTFIEKMNEALAVAGRAIGHRVLQSAEYYMANYPDVRDAQRGFLRELSKAQKDEGPTSKPVEYFLEKYPEVRSAYEQIDEIALGKALHVAFEDQLVQKVMPKLRGIDTVGKGRTDCLDKILAQINGGIGGEPFNLADDFNLSCELGYGQFIWQSAKYLDESNSGNLTDSVAEAETPQPAELELEDKGTKTKPATKTTKAKTSPKSTKK